MVRALAHPVSDESYRVAERIEEAGPYQAHIIHDGQLDVIRTESGESVDCNTEDIKAVTAAVDADAYITFEDDAWATINSRRIKVSLDK